MQSKPQEEKDGKKKGKKPTPQPQTRQADPEPPSQWLCLVAKERKGEVEPGRTSRGFIYTTQPKFTPPTQIQ
jgi:hypothetical protein